MKNWILLRFSIKTKKSYLYSYNILNGNSVKFLELILILDRVKSEIIVRGFESLINLLIYLIKFTPQTYLTFYQKI
jgi:hypothetical protein